MASLKKIFLKNPSYPLFWILLGFIFKGIVFLSVIFHHPYHDIAGVWGATQGDDSSYLDPIDNLLQHGTYSPDYRMPGYGAVYLLFRLIFAQVGACNALIIFQLILASVSVYYLALTARNILKNEVVFYITFYLFLLSSFSNFFDAYIGSESLCTSALIFSVYFFARYFKKPKSKYLFYAGFLLTWGVFIRPVFGGVLAACCFIILFQQSVVLHMKIKHLFLFLIPFLLIEGFWIYRNYRVHKSFTPFTSSGAFYPEQATSYLQPLFEFTQSWGGACSFVSKSSSLDWFQYHYKGMPPILHYDSLPDDIYTSAFNKDSLIKLKRMILTLQNSSIDTIIASTYQHQLRIKLTEYRRSFKKEKPFTYFIIAPLKMIGVMLYGYETSLYLERGQSVPFLGGLLFVFNTLLYLLVLLYGLVGSILLIIIGLKERLCLLIIPFIPLYTILIHPFVFRFFHARFFMPAYPFLILCSAYFIHTIYRQYYQHSRKG